MLTHKKRLLTLIISVLTAVSFALSGCSPAAPGSSSVAASTAASASSVAASSQEAPPEPFGKPWQISMLQGTLPDKAPEFKDDIYTHYNYDFLKEYQSKSYTNLVSHANEIDDAIIKAINENKLTGPAYEQLKIFMDQAKDLDTQKRIGFSEVQPYIDMIDAVDSIDKMNELLVSDRFPFTPFIISTLGLYDTRENMAVAVWPNFVFSDLTELGTYYQETDDANKRQQWDNTLMLKAFGKMIDANLLGIEKEKMQQTVMDIIAFEKAYGKYADSNERYVTGEYGTLAQATKDSFLTLDQLCALSPKMPMKAMLAKCKKDNAEKYVVASPKWVSALNDLWTEENLETLKLVAKVKVLDETRAFRDQSKTLEMITPDAKLNPDTVAYSAGKDLNTFAHLFAKIYVEECLGSKAKDRMVKMTKDLVSTYKEMVDKTVWLDDMSAALIQEKLDHLTLNVLEPASGYCDYAGLELTPTDKGGTLLSNYFKLKEYRYEWEAKRIGRKAVADTSWNLVTPLIPNAFYDYSTNSINICPGIITSVVYKEDMDDTELLAQLGYIVGHEISHGFDYMGSQIDAYGQPKPVLSDAALEAFLKKCKSIADYYSAVEYLPGKFINGQTVVAEAAADLSGFQSCLELLKKQGEPDYEKFFKNMTNIWAQSIGKQELEVYAVDSHPLNILRVNVNAQMFDVIYDKFGVKEGDGMYLAPEKRIVVFSDK